MLHIGIDGHNLEGNRTGVGRYLENLLKEFSKMPELEGKIKFTVYFKKEKQTDRFFESPIFHLKSLKIPIRSSFFAYFNFLLPYNAYKDGVDTMWFPGYMVPYTWCGRSIMVLHDIIFERYPASVPWLHRTFYRLYGRYGVKRSEKILTVSEFSKKEVTELYNVNSEKIIVTPLGIDKKFQVIELDDDFKQVKEKYGIKQDFIMYVGQIFQRRHVVEVIKAYAGIAEEFPNFQLLVIGKDRTNPPLYIDKLTKDINDTLGKQGIIRKEFVPDEDLPFLYNAAKAGFYLSDYEGFGLPPLEFLACGTPVFAPNSTALKTTLQGRQVIIENTNDIKEIQEKLRKVLNDKIYLEAMKARGPEYARQFSWKKCADITLNVFLK